jgi:uncharacterized protein YbjT (DUF2867 family)
MNILLTGYSGFLGSRILMALLSAGHRVICAGRREPPAGLDGGAEFVQKDFLHDTDASAWVPHLVGVDVAINAAGVLATNSHADLANVHTHGPIALFDACVAAGVRRVIQVSALGADTGAATLFHTSKRAADEHLRRQPIEHVIVQPSLVYGRAGRSSALFAALASAPLIPLPGDGTQRVQPIHVDDLVAGVVAALADRDACGATIPFVGPEPLTLRAFLSELRAALGLGRARFVRVPLPLVQLVARVGTLTGRGLLNRDTLAMLVRGNVADPEPLRRLLQRHTRRVRSFVDASAHGLDRREAQLGWLIPTLRWSMAAMWLVSGIVSLVYPVDSSLRLLATTGITTEWLAFAALYGAALLDISFGIAILAVRRRRVLWAAQILVVLAYTAIITARLPELWLEPFGPILKNLPILAALWLLYETEERGWNT